MIHLYLIGQFHHVSAFLNLAVSTDLQRTVSGNKWPGTGYGIANALLLCCPNYRAFVRKFCDQTMDQAEDDSILHSTL